MSGRGRPMNSGVSGGPGTQPRGHGMDSRFSVEIKDGIFRMTVVAPKQLLLHPEWEQMVWDHALRLAHESGLMPVGPIHISTEEYEPPKQELREGESLTERIQRWQEANLLGVLVDQVKIIAEVQIGLSVE